MPPINNNRQCIYQWKFQKAFPARLMLLLFPIDILSVEETSQKILVPLTAPVNGRDVTLTRIMDETIEAYIQYSSAHVLFGKLVDQEEGDGEHNVVGVFNREYCSQSKFSTQVDFLYLQERIITFLSTLATTKGTCMRNPAVSTHSCAQNAKATEGTTPLLCFFLSCLQYSFNNFDTVECFQTLNRAVHEAARIFRNRGDALNEDLIPIDSEGTIPIEVKAIINFQIYMYPSMCSLMDGNHRSMRVLLDMVGCSRDRIYSLESPGIPLCSEAFGTNSAYNPLIVYHFYDLKDSTKSSRDYCVSDLQYVSKTQSDQIAHSMVEEFCNL
jgi:hypothetical protein